MSKCLKCRKSFRRSRAWQRFCSAPCRIEWHKNRVSRERSEIETLRQALRVIHTWATYDCGAYLDPSEVVKLTEKALGEKVLNAPQRATKRPTIAQEAFSPPPARK